ncbi:MAG: hypothetical protein RIE52_11895 [Balneola sp.]
MEAALEHKGFLKMVGDWIDTLIGAVVTGFFGLAWKVYRFLKSNNLKKTLEERERNWVSVGEITRNTRFGRAYVMKTSNGGGIPSANKPLNGTVLFCSGDEFPNIEDYWVKRPIGRVLNTVLLKSLSENDGTQYFSEDLENGEFRTMLKAHNVKYGICRKIVESKNGKDCYWLFMDAKECISMMHKEKEVANNALTILSKNLMDD